MFTSAVINHYDDDTSTIYTCPNCNNSIKFSIRDFDKHWQSGFTNLKGEDFIGAPYGKGFMDFYCPKCALPTTVTFKREAGGMNGKRWYTIDNADRCNTLKQDQ